MTEETVLTPVDPRSEAISVERKERVREEVKKLRNMLEMGFIHIGRLLYEVKEGEYWREWGYPSYRAYVETELSLKDRRARYYVSVFAKFIVELKRDEQELLQLGWTKANLIQNYVDSENVDKWVEHAARTPYGALHAEVEYLKRDRKEAIKEHGEPGEPKPLVPLGGDEEKCEPVSFFLFPAQKKNLEDALEEVKKTANSEKRGHLLDCIMVEFLSSHRVPAEQDAELEWWIEQMQGRFPEVVVLAFKDRKQLVPGLRSLMAKFDPEYKGPKK